MTFRRIGKGKSREEKCLWLCLCAALLISICFIALKGRKYLDSDMASEMILANLLNQEGGVLSKNWFYSTELRVFCLQPFYRIGLLIQPHDWYMARVIGQMLCLIATIVSYLYMGHNLVCAIMVFCQQLHLHARLEHGIYFMASMGATICRI